MPDTTPVGQILESEKNTRQTGRDADLLFCACLVASRVPLPIAHAVVFG